MLLNWQRNFLIKNKKITGWKEDIQNIAAAENVYCKISGMVTEADLENWKKDEFNPYIDTVVEAFGTNRIMYGSDWPVCLLAAPYGLVLDIVKEYFSSFSKNEQDNFFGKNACTFYNLN
jgi:L-fuconolactonase